MVRCRWEVITYWEKYCGGESGEVEYDVLMRMVRRRRLAQK